jgi:hypothetical protein
MELIIVIAIVLAALFFSVRSFVKIYKGEDSCNCGSGCSRSSKELCNKGSEPFKTV